MLSFGRNGWIIILSHSEQTKWIHKTIYKSHIYHDSALRNAFCHMNSKPAKYTKYINIAYMANTHSDNLSQRGINSFEFSISDGYNSVLDLLSNRRKGKKWGSPGAIEYIGSEKVVSLLEKTCWRELSHVFAWRVWKKIIRQFSGKYIYKNWLAQSGNKPSGFLFFGER